MKKATNPRAPKSASAKAAMVSGQSKGWQKSATIRAERKAKGLCPLCGGPLPDPREKKREKLERKIAQIKDQIRVLMAAPKPGAPVPPSTDEDTPLAELTRKRV